MCTLIAFHRVWVDAPIVVATNRDEAYARPSSPPRWQGASPAVLAPVDERAGGTWMGANERGLWVGLTNRRSSAERPLRSRGLLCRELLDLPDAGSAAAALAALEETYNPFHVVIADAERMILVEQEDGRASSRALPPGCHIVTNRPFDETSGEPKARRARRLLALAGLWPAGIGGTAPDDLEERLGRILADHGDRGEGAICLHGVRGGTKSSAVWRVAPGGGEAGASNASPASVAVAFADGPPCVTPFRRLGGAAPVDGFRGPA